MNARRNPFELLEGHSAVLFLVAGVLLIGYAALTGVEAFTTATVEPNLFEFGYVLGFLGLLGLYPRLVDQQPWLARVGAGAAVSGAVAISAFNVGHLAEIGGLVSNGLPGRPGFVVMALIGFVFGYLATGTAVLRSAVYPRLYGLVLLAPGVVVVLMLVHIAAGFDSAETAFVISTGQAMTHLAIGATLRAKAEAADAEEVDAEADADAAASG